MNVYDDEIKRLESEESILSELLTISESSLSNYKITASTLKYMVTYETIIEYKKRLYAIRLRLRLLHGIG